MSIRSMYYSGYLPNRQSQSLTEPSIVMGTVGAVISRLSHLCRQSHRIKVGASQSPSEPIKGVRNIRIFERFHRTICS